MVIDPRTSVIGTSDIIELDFEALLKVGDYFEISSSDARTTAYAVYRSVAKEVKPNGVMIITGVELFKSSDVIQQGFNYKIKFYDKTSGLTLDDVNDLFVFKSGDDMTGRLHISIPGGTAERGLLLRDTDSNTLFSVDNTGKCIVGNRDFLIHEDNGDRDFFKFEGGTATSTYFPELSGSVNFVSKANQNFNFFFDSAQTLGVADSRLNLFGKKITDVLRPTEDSDGVNLEFLFAQWPQTEAQAANKTSFLAAPKDHFKFHTDANHRVEMEVYKISANDLTDFDYGNGDNLQEGHSLIWDSSLNAWVPTSTKATPFKPGDTVCYLGTTPGNNVQVGGFFYNDASKLLQFANQVMTEDIQQTAIAEYRPVRLASNYRHGSIAPPFESALEMPVPPFESGHGWFTPKGNDKFTGARDGFIDFNFEKCTGGTKKWKFAYLMGESEYSGSGGKPPEWSRDNWSFNDTRPNNTASTLDECGLNANTLFTNGRGNDGNKKFRPYTRKKNNLSNRFMWGVMEKQSLPRIHMLLMITLVSPTMLEHQP